MCNPPLPFRSAWINHRVFWMQICFLLSMLHCNSLFNAVVSQGGFFSPAIITSNGMGLVSCHSLLHWSGCRQYTFWIFHSWSVQWRCIWHRSATEAWEFAHPWIMQQPNCDPAQVCEDDCPSWSSPLVECNPWDHPLLLGKLLPFKAASSLLFFVRISYVCESQTELVLRNYIFSTLNSLSLGDLKAVKCPQLSRN